MRILWGLVVGTIGCVITYFATLQLGGIGELIFGPFTGKVFTAIVALGGIAITLALAFAAAKPARKTPRPQP